MDLDSIFALKSFFSGFGCGNITFIENKLNSINLDFRFTYLLNIFLINLEEINNLLIIGSNPRLEAPLLNSRLRKNYLKNSNFKVYSIGLALNYLTYPIKNIGNSIINLLKFLKGNMLEIKYFLFQDFFNLTFFNNLKKPLSLNILIGNSILTRLDSNSILNCIYILFNNLELSYNNLNLLPRFIGRLSAFEIGCLLGINSQINIFNSKKD
jgi:hypothetical protein